MKIRTAGVLVGILALVCFGLIFGAVYPFTTSSPHAATPPGDRFTVGDADAYSAAGRIIVEGETRLAFEGVVTADGEWYQRVVEPNVTSETYRASPNSSVYKRLTITGRDRAASYRAQITEDEDRILLREERDGDRVTFVVEQPDTDGTERVSGTASVFVNSLLLTRYGNVGTGSSGVALYEPRSGWYDGTRAYRITDASGTVAVDEETHAVHSANVSWEVTQPAGTYLEYILARLSSDDPTTHRITFDFDPDDTALERPSWVPDPDPESDVRMPSVTGLAPEHPPAHRDRQAYPLAADLRPRTGPPGPTREPGDVAYSTITHSPERDHRQ